MSGIIGIVSINGNGFYCPTTEQLETYIINESNCFVDLQNTEYPLSVTLIGFQQNDNTYFKQVFIAHNKNQVKYIYKNFTKYAAVIPTVCLNKVGLSLPEDYIINVYKIDQYKNIK
jgi:hypothetical protein